MSLTIKHRVSLDLSLTSVQATIPFRKGDKGAHEVVFSLRNGTTNVELPPGTIATIAVFNGANEGKGVVDMCTVDHINHRIIYIPTVAALSVAGNVACELVVTGTNGEELGAPRIHFFVDESMTDVTEKEIAEALKASSSWDVIQQTAMNAKAAAQSKVDAQKWADGTDVTSDDPQYQKNAKYYAEEAAEQRDVAAQFVADARKWADGTGAVFDEQQYKNNAKYHAEQSKRWAIGDSTEDGNDPSQNNAKYYSIQSSTYAGEARYYADQVGQGAKRLEASINPLTYELTLSLLSAVGTELSSKTIALPLEELITHIEYNKENKDLIFTLRNGETLEVELDAIVSELVTTTTLNDKLKDKVDKITTARRLYGTNSAGVQTSYFVADDIGDDTVNPTLTIMTQAAVKAIRNSLSMAIDINSTKIEKNAEDIAANTNRISELEKGGGNAEQIVKEELAKYFIVEESINLFDKSAVELTPGLIMSNGTILTNANISHFLFPVEVGKTYTFPIYYSSIGYSAAYNMPCYNAAGEYLGTITGTPTADNAYLTFTNTDTVYSTTIWGDVPNAGVAYIKLNVAVVANVSPNLDTFMIVEGDTYPSEYHAFGAGGVTLNPDVQVNGASTDPLFGKKVVFTGDSICAGTSDETGIRGWAQRIGEKYSMSWQNKGINGATITSGVSGSSACIADTDFGENPDYIILEGGVNDADLIKTADTFTPAKYGSFNNYSFTSDFDKTTFCGAVEHLFKRVTTDYVGAKIGFIIAHKQGMATSAMDYTAEQSYRRFYFETIIKLCKKWGIPYLDLWEGCYLCPMNPAHNTKDTNLMYVGDYQHLASKGYDYITPMIEAWMKTL